MTIVRYAQTQEMQSVVRVTKDESRHIHDESRRSLNAVKKTHCIRTGRLKAIFRGRESEDGDGKEGV